MRKLLLLTFVVLIATGIWMWWRLRVDAALDAALTNGPDFNWEVDPLSSLSLDDYLYLQSDHENVSDRLLEIATSDDGPDRRVNAIKTLRNLAARSGSFENRKRLLPQLISLACDSTTPSFLLPELTETVADWAPSTGVSSEQRDRIREVALTAPEQQRIRWIPVLIEIGGRDEIVMVLNVADSLDADEFHVVWNSRLRSVTWLGMLPHVEEWIHDPSIADRALEFSVLSLTHEGRQVLLQYLSDDSQQGNSRAKAVEELSSTLAGIDLLASACADQEFADNLSNLLEQDSQQYLLEERNKINARNGDELWDELIKGLDHDYWLPESDVIWGRASETPPEVEAERGRLREHFSQLSLQCLRVLSEKPELSTPEEWRQWQDTEAPDPLPLNQLLTAALNDPDLLGCSAIMRRIVPYKLGFIPDDCLPVYQEMLSSENPAVQYNACKAILTFAHSPEAIDVAIDLIEQSKPSEVASVHPGEIDTLQNRYAVNFFWDTDAWRDWARNPD